MTPDEICRRLVRNNTEIIEVRLLRAKKEGAILPIACVVDLRAKLGRAVSELARSPAHLVQVEEMVQTTDPDRVPWNLIVADSLTLGERCSEAMALLENKGNRLIARSCSAEAEDAISEFFASDPGEGNAKVMAIAADSSDPSGSRFAIYYGTIPLPSDS
jgi:hypothetical protein